jgi:hypothetical protein
MSPLAGQQSLGVGAVLVGEQASAGEPTGDACGPGEGRRVVEDQAGICDNTGSLVTQRMSMRARSCRTAGMAAARPASSNAPPSASLQRAPRSSPS